VSMSLLPKPKQFWKYVSIYKREDNTFIKIKVGDQLIFFSVALSPFGPWPPHI
jgi:hypothetical protein